MRPLHNLACSLVVATAAITGALVLTEQVETARAASARAFTSAAFEAAKKAGRPILIEVSAPWCSVCRAQKPILARLLAQPKFAKLAFFQVDFDSQKDALRMLGVASQSTLISFKGAKEVGRSTGVTDAEAIEDQLNKSI